MAKIKNFAKEKILQLSSNFKVRKFFQIPFIKKFAKPIYFKMFGPRNGKCSYVIDGVSCNFRVNDKEEFDCIMSGANFETHMLKILLQEIKPGDNVFDVGACMGFHSIFFAEKAGSKGRVIAFEPDDKRFGILCENIKNNNLEKNILPLKIALGDSIKKGRVERVPDGDLKIRETDISDSEGVEIVPGDMVIKDKNLPYPNVIKIDREGYEYSVINGMEDILKQKQCRIVCCEIHLDFLPPEVTSDMVLNKLKGFGFNNIKTFPPRWNTFHAICYKD